MTATSRTAVDPHAVICELVAAVEPDLPSETVRKAIGQAVRSKSAAVRLVQALEADPELMTSGRAEGPASVERFIRALTELGAAHVVRPPCSRCGRLRPLGSIGGSGRRVCSSCSGSGNRKGAGSGWACAICGNGDTPRYGLDRTGREVCRTCYKTQCTEDPGDDLLGYLDGLALGLDEAVLRTVIAEVTGGNTSVTRRLLWDLQTSPAC